VKILFTLLFLTLIYPAQAQEQFHFSTEQKPNFSADFYISQGEKYFDTLDTYASRSSKPVYSSHVIRWEWYPWLFLTGYRKFGMKFDRFLVLYPTRVVNRNCQAFPTQPFTRCRVTFIYEKSQQSYDIYEEFTFNSLGEVTFIEAWTDHPDYLPMNPAEDYWGEGENVARISTKVPGLGRPNGKFDRKQLAKLAQNDQDLKNLLKRLRLPISFWIYEGIRFLINHP
jgi:hypothetical protein